MAGTATAYREEIVSKRIRQLSSKFDFYELSMNPRIKMKHFLEFPDMPWNYTSYQWNVNFRIEDAIANPEKPWDWNVISYYAKIDHVLNYPNLPWNWKNLSKSAKIKVSEAIENMQFPWDWDGLSVNPTLKKSDLEKNPHLPWNAQIVTAISMGGDRVHRVGLDRKTIEQIKIPIPYGADPDPNWNPWEWSFFVAKYHLRFSHVLSNPSAPWDWNIVSGNRNITMSMIDAHPEFPWDYQGLSENLNLTFDFVEKRIDAPWNWSKLSLFTEIFEPTVEEAAARIAGMRIARYVYKSFVDPRYLMCRRRLMREFENAKIDSLSCNV